MNLQKDHIQGDIQDQQRNEMELDHNETHVEFVEGCPFCEKASRVQVYKCNLRGLDVEDFLQNPVVTFLNDVNRVVGKAEILKGKTKVRVYYFEEVPPFEHTIGASTVNVGPAYRTLYGLSVIMVLEDPDGD